MCESGGWVYVCQSHLPGLQTLGISRGADEATIKKNYRNLAKYAALRRGG